MAEDWLADVKKYVPDADPAAVAAIVRYCGIALQKRDSSLVSMSDPKETGRVRENFLKKKLALTDPDETLDAAISSVGERMKADRTKNRVTVYYLLAEHFGKLGLFGGGATATGGTSAGDTSDAAGAAALGAAGLAAGAAAAVGGGGGENAPSPAAAAPAPADSGIGALSATGAAAVGSAVAGAAAAASGAGSAVSGGANEAASRLADIPDDGGSGSGMGKWLLWLLLALVLIALFFGLRSCMNRQATVASNASDTMMAGDLSGTADNGTAAIDANQATAAPAAALNAPTPPVGAGVVASTRNSLPMLTVYFDTGKADVAKDFATSAGGLKDYVAAHPDAKLAVSGFNDPTGNAATNAALSKRRAQGVAAALEATGVPATAVALEKPADTTVTGSSNAEARRVEVTVKQ